MWKDGRKSWTLSNLWTLTTIVCGSKHVGFTIPKIGWSPNWQMISNSIEVTNQLDTQCQSWSKSQDDCNFKKNLDMARPIIWPLTFRRGPFLGHSLEVWETFGSVGYSLEKVSINFQMFRWFVCEWNGDFARTNRLYFVFSICLFSPVFFFLQRYAFHVELHVSSFPSAERRNNMKQ